MRRADHLSGGVLPTVVRRCVCSRNLLNEEALALLGGGGLLRQKNALKLIRENELLLLLLFPPLFSSFLL